MNIPTPHFFLFSQANRGKQGDEWSFVLKAADGSAKFEAADSEPDAYGERLELLAVVRGLEALEQPSRVTLVTPSRYVSSGISYGLPEWGRNGWMWEHFGELVPVKNRDLWQRLDRALKIHQIRGSTYRIDAPHAASAGDQSGTSEAEVAATGDATIANRWGLGPFAARCAARLRAWLERIRVARDHYRTSLLPCPWLE